MNSSGKEIAQTKIEVIYQDDKLLVVNKTSGFLVLPDRFDRIAPNMLAVLKKSFGSIYVVHRLDRDTTGVIVFARDQETHRNLCGQFSGREVKKIYWAVTSGVPVENKGTISLPLSRGDRGKTLINAPDGKEAVTGYTTIERFKGYALIEVAPETGRMHQIRAHLKAIGHPVIADPLYGDGRGFYLSDIKPNYKKKDEEEKPLLDRTALHAKSISFLHPMTGEKVTFEAPLPKDMQRVLKYLRTFRSV